jgi:hypothetical protein
MTFMFDNVFLVINLIMLTNKTTQSHITRKNHSKEDNGTINDFEESKTKGARTTHSYPWFGQCWVS